MRQWYDGVGMGILAVGTVVALIAVPVAAWTEVARPEVRALYAYGGVLAVLAWLRWSGRELLEPRILAVFLAAMPLVYLEAGWSAGAPLGVRGVGPGSYAALAVAGRREPGACVGRAAGIRRRLKVRRRSGGQPQRRKDARPDGSAPRRLVRRFPEASVHGSMMDQPLLISSILRFAERFHGSVEVISR